MARNMYGATSADFTITSGGRVIPGAVLTLWTARTGGTQITDLLDVDSVATTTVTSAADGSVVYYGPDSDADTHWADSGQGSRIAIRPVDITGEPPTLTVGTVTTGTADVTISGTSPEYTLDFVLPPVGANGVDTAAIADSAVTSAKIADGTIVDADINAAAAIARTKVAGYSEGTAVPNGSVTGNPGDVYLQTSTAATVSGALTWRKATGTGSTGWVAEGALADTGWRSIASWDAAGTVTGTMPPDIVPRTGVAGYIHLRRFGTTVVLAFMAIQLNGPGPNMSAANIAGFRDIGGADQWISMYNGSAWSNPLVCQTAGAGYATWIMPGTTGHFNLRTAWTWQTSDAWPSSLPGSAV